MASQCMQHGTSVLALHTVDLAFESRRRFPGRQARVSRHSAKYFQKVHWSLTSGKLCGCHQCRRNVNAESTAGELQPDKRGQTNDLDEALNKVQAALREAENALKDVDQLPSAQLPRKRPAILRVATLALQIGLVAGILVAAHSFGLAVTVSLAAACGAGVAFAGYKKGSLSLSGAVAAAVVGGVTMGASVQAACTLLAFFASSSKLTTYCEDRKSDDEDFKHGGQRDWKQVACNGAVPAILALGAAVASAGVAFLPLASAAVRQRTALIGAFLGYYSCCCADTWASEVGQLSEDTPRLITSLRPVRKGTNGGVTRLGLAASAAGGLLMGVCFYCSGLLASCVLTSSAAQAAAVRQWALVPFGLIAGLCGSLLDSVLGATVQFTGYNRVSRKITSKLSSDVTPISGFPLLDNNAVNLVSASTIAAFSGAAALLLF